MPEQTDNLLAGGALTERQLADLHLAYARALEGEAGRLVLADLARQGFLLETSFSPDPQRAAFNEGRRSLALYIRRMAEGPKPRRQAAAGSAGQPGHAAGPNRR